MIQRVACDYRLAFFQQLHAGLQEKGIAFELVAGLPWEGEGFVDVLDQLPFGTRLRNIRLFKNVYWEEGALAACKNADLVIFEQANAALHLYPLLLGIHHRGQKIAFYGHGAHLNKSKPHPMRDAWRRFWSTRVDWWFAYTQLSADIVLNDGFPMEKMTVVNNAIDTDELRVARNALSDGDLDATYQKLFGLPKGKEITGIFCARLTELKWIPFLLEALLLIKARVPGFTMIIIGDGPYADEVKNFCTEHPWCHWAGAVHGTKRVELLALGDVWLNPGMTGLSILDAFAMGMPFFTVDSGIHSPEIAYLQDGRNGGLCGNDPKEFAASVVEVCLDAGHLSAMKQAATKDGEKYTTASMAKNFAGGIAVALGIGEKATS